MLSCAAGLTECGGACRALQIDRANCGSVANGGIYCQTVMWQCLR